MITKFKNWLKKSDLIYVVCCAIKSVSFRSYCADFGRNCRMFRFEHRGEENPGKNVYYIQEGSSAQGMFSILTWTLRRLEVADRFSFIPVVQWAEDIPFNDHKQSNPFRLYFQNVSEITTESALKSSDVAFSNSWDRAYGDAADSYEFSDEEVARLARIYHKYIRLNEDIKARICRENQELLGREQGKTLGVHVRGVDWRKAKVYKHPIAITEEEYLNRAVAIMRDLQYEKIFLASDSEHTIELFKKEFGSCLITAEAARTPIGGHALAIFDEKNDGYQMGYEILRDAYALAACDSLLCGLSYVSYGARIIRLSEGRPYDNVVILDKGKADKGISLREAEHNERKETHTN